MSAHRHTDRHTPMTTRPCGLWRAGKNLIRYFRTSLQLGPLHGSSSPFSPLNRQGLSPIKPVYDPDQPDGRLNLTASAFNQLGQYTSSPGHRDYCCAELADFFPSGGRNHRQYSLRLPTEGWPD